MSIFFQNRHLQNPARSLIWVFIGCIFIIMSAVKTVFPVDVDDLEIIPKKVLDQGGISADIALNPVDGSVHVAWVKNGDIKYAFRNPAGGWSSIEFIPDAGLEVFGTDELDSLGGDRPRKCLGITVDDQGNSHLIFGTRNQGIHHIQGTPGNWGAPVKTHNGISIYNDIVVADGKRVTVWEDGIKDQIYTQIYQNGKWEGAISMGRGEYPSIYADGNTIYFLTRNRKTPRNATIAYMQPGTTTWNFTYEIADPDDRLGEGPQLAFGQNTIYMAWSNSEPVDILKKAQLYCAVANKPGTQWQTKMGSSDPLWYEDTAAPHPRAAVLNDGSVLYFNGRRRYRQFLVYNEAGWSHPREAPWNSGIAQVASDGFSTWIVISPYDYNKEFEVSVTGISAPKPDHSDELIIGDKTVVVTSGFSGEIALHPLDGSLHCAWVSAGNIKYKVRDISGSWSSVSTLPDAGQRAEGLDEGGFTRKCLAFDIDPEGQTHYIFTAANGNVYYGHGTPGNWTPPIVIASGTSNSAYPDVVARNDGLYCTFEAAVAGDIYFLEMKNDTWTKEKIGPGGLPSICNGHNGRIYLLYQENTGSRNVHFLHKVPGFTGWQSSNGILDPANSVGWRPGMAVGNDKIYLAWNNDKDVSGDFKSEMFCAAADEPGDWWTTRLGQVEPLYYENTGDPFPRVCVYSDTRVLYLNGRRSASRITFWNGIEWSKTRSGPWADVAPDVKSDGRTAWIFASSSYDPGSEVSITAIENPNAEKNDLYDQWPVFTTSPPQTAVANQTWIYNCHATDPGQDNLTYALVQAPQGMSINGTTGRIEWIPGDADRHADIWNQGEGVHLVGIKVKDDHGGFKTQYFWLQVVENSTNNPPQITSTPVTQVQEGSIYSYLVAATDTDFDPLTFSLTQAPPNMTIGAASGNINWATTVADVGIHPVTVVVSDGRGGTDSQNFSVEVIAIVIPAPVADFTANRTSGVVPLTVQFSDKSTGEITDYEWDFGDGSTSQITNPSHQYQTPGLYTVSLTVTGPGGTDQEIKQEYIQVNDIVPTADFTATPLQGIVPLSVQFTDQSTGNITTYSWNFGDGGTSTAQNPRHTFNATGEYTVSLQVNGPGGTDSETKENYIKVREAPPVAQFGAEPRSGDLPLTVQFSDSSSGLITGWLWNFGDGQTSTLQNPQHTFNSPGIFDVALEVTGPGGSDTEVKEDYITVQGIAPIAAFRAEPREGWAPLQVQFTNLSSGNYYSQVWNFGDGVTSDSANPVHIYSTPAKYEVTLMVTGPGGSDMETKTDYINVIDAKPMANFSATPTDGKTPLTVQFSDFSTGQIDTWLWDFGDGEKSSLPNPEHTYTVPGTYTVSLLVSGPQGSDAKTMADYIQVSGEKPIAGFSADPLSGTVPLTVQFYDESTGTITSRQWNFGDGITSSETNPLHIFQEAGNFTVSLMVTGPGGSDTKILNNYITVTEPAPVAGFSGSPLSGHVPLIVMFTDSSKGIISTRIWDFGDGTTSSSTNPSHLYLQQGEYTVKLTVNGPGGNDTRIRENYILVIPPVPRAYFVADPLEGDVPLTVLFSDSSSGDIMSWRWDFGDSSTAEGPNPSHIYSKPGRYSVKLTVEGPGGSNTLVRPNYINCKFPMGIESTDGSPQTFTLYQNYPNPFNGSTTIAYQVPKTVPVFLGVFDIRGHLVTVLHQGQQAPGSYKLLWNGTDDTGQNVASGIYMIQLLAGGFQANQKLIYLK
ncbi:PKD domain-containing protein [candidate division KSB1 bacterium]|nr:PKD domain-containing protein [candidate division KSB1 bacterium]